ncbi:hypothetical protein D9M72_335420 [compost metagenome]
MDAPGRLALQRVVGIRRGLDRAGAAAQALRHEQADEEGAEVAAAADGGQIVELGQQRGQPGHGLRRGGGARRGSWRSLGVCGGG